MNRLWKKRLLLVIIWMQSFFGNAQHTERQFSFHDSLHQLLTYFHDQTKDEKLRHAIEKAQHLYTSDTINDSIAASLVAAGNVLVAMHQEAQYIMDHSFSKGRLFDTSKILSFTETTVNALRLLPSRGKSPYYASALSNQFFFRILETANYSGYFNLLKEAFIIRTKILQEQDPDYIESLITMARAYIFKGDTAYAESLASRAWNLMNRNNVIKDNAYARNLLKLACFYQDRNQYNKARALFEEDIVVRKKTMGEENPRYALELEIVGDRYMYMFDYKNALPLFEQAAVITKNNLGEENPQYLLCLNNLGGYYYTTGKYEKALPYFIQDLYIKEKLFGKGYDDIALSLHNLATTYIKMGRYEEALPLFQRTLKIVASTTGKISKPYAFYLPFLASLYQNMGQYNEALVTFKQALQVTEKTFGQDHQYYGRCLNKLAVLCEAMGKSGESLPYLQKAQKIIVRVSGTRSPDYASNLNNMASLFKRMGHYKKAGYLFNEALKIRKKLFGEEHADYAATLKSLGDLNMQMGKYNAAKTFFMRSLEIIKKVLGEEHPDYIKNLNNLGRLEILLKHPRAASELFITSNSLALKQILRTYTSLSEQEKITLINEQYIQFSYLPSLLFAKNDNRREISDRVYTNEVALKGIVLNDQQHVFNSILKSHDSVALALLDLWRSNNDLLGKQVLLPLAKQHNFDSLQEAALILEQQLSRISAAFSNQQNKIFSPVSISGKLQKGEAAIEFMHFNLFSNELTHRVIYAALIIKLGDSSATFVPLFEEKQLQRLLTYSKTGIATPVNLLYPGTKATVSKENNFGSSLYTLIWKPLEKYLNGINTIYYSPAGLLHRIALQALPVGDSILLIDKFRLNQLMSTRYIGQQVKTAIKLSDIAIWGDIDYNYQINVTGDLPVLSPPLKKDTLVTAFNFYTYVARELRANTFGPLPGTKLEIASLMNLFANAGIRFATTAGAIALEERFRDFNGNSPQVIHIATHGFSLPLNTAGNAFAVQQNPMFRSGLVLAGGNHAWKGEAIASGREDGILTAYEIAHMDLSNTDLVVLSACETALGDLHGNEGVIGLQRAFRIAGVKQMIVSLWRVPDKQTVELMTLFYRNWMNGQSTREALRSAQLKMKEKYPPVYWAAFILVE